MDEDIKKDKDFVDYIMRNDELSVVLKCHLEIERDLDALIKVILPQAEVILKWSFLDKIEILCALGIVGDRISKGLKMINTIRNKFAHEYAYRLSKDDILSLKNVGMKTKIEIPDEFKKFPNIEIIMLMIMAVGYLGTHLNISGKLWQQNPEIAKKMALSI